MRPLSQLLLTPGDASALLSRRVREARKARGWNQTELAERAGVSVNTVARLEQSGSAQLGNFLRILTALGHLADLEAVLRPPEPRSMDELRERATR